VLPRLFETYPDQVRLVYRDFPLTSIHSSAFAAAEAANCAGEQDAYWAYHDKLFVSELGLGKGAFEQYAGQLGLDMEAFNACVGDRRYQEEVAADIDYAMNLGIRSTPTFFINGIALVGAQPFEVFKDVIDKELAGEFPQ
jgi:protein-disulfide isomerase